MGLGPYTRGDGERGGGLGWGGVGGGVVDDCKAPASKTVVVPETFFKSLGLKLS